jgi:hypothetical protein
MAFPGLEPVALITSSQDKAGHDAATFARLDGRTGGTATTDVDAALNVSDAVADVASGDIRADGAVVDIERCLRAGKHIVTPALGLPPRTSGGGAPRVSLLTRLPGTGCQKGNPRRLTTAG